MAPPIQGITTHPIPTYNSFIDLRKDERLSWPGWLTCCRWFTHNSGHPSAAGRAQDKKSLPARDRRSTTVPCNQPFYNLTGQTKVSSIVREYVVTMLFFSHILVLKTLKSWGVTFWAILQYVIPLTIHQRYRQTD